MFGEILAQRQLLQKRLAQKQKRHSWHIQASHTIRRSGELDESEAELDSEAEDPHAQLGEWLDQLQVLSKELDGVRPNMVHSGDASVSIPRSPQLPSAIPTTSTALPRGADSALLRPRQKPVIPPKPRMDAYRYSMVNLQDSPDVDLDALLGELCELESQLNSNTSDSWLTQLNSGAKPSTSFTETPTARTASECRPAKVALPPPPVASKSTAIHSSINSSSVPGPSTSVTVPSHAINPHGPKSSSGIGRNSFDAGIALSSEPFSKDGSSKGSGSDRAHSPDNDSAFCDSASMLSSEEAHCGSHRSRDSNGSSAESSRASLTAPSPTQLIDNVHCHIRKVQEEIQKQQDLSEIERQERLKDEKIKLALEKMKEASIKKIYVKVFAEDGGSRSLLVDERWTVALVLQHLAEKSRTELCVSHAIVEHYPDLHMERIYEDHEYLVENILLWTSDSANKLIFLERSDKFAFISNPQGYLLNETSVDKAATLSDERRQQIVDEFFAPSHVQPPELESLLWLKADGKKAWKKHYFVLRASGLYYVPKGKSKSSKDLVCLMQLEMIQSYIGFGWKKKYKAPTDYGFALKHPQIQVKASKYIKYLCCEDEQMLNRWIVGLRIAKCGRQLYENYQSSTGFLESDDGLEFLERIRSGNTASTPVSNGSAEDGFFHHEAVVIRPKQHPGDLTPSHISISSRSSSSDVSSPLTSSTARTRMPDRRSSSASVSSAGTSGSSMSSGSRRDSRNTVVAAGVSTVQEPFNTVQTISSPRLNSSSTQRSVTFVDSSPHDSKLGHYMTNGSGSETPTPDSSSASMTLAFEADVCHTNTIKRRPPPSSLMSSQNSNESTDGSSGLQMPSSLYASAALSAKLPLTDTTKQLHFASSMLHDQHEGEGIIQRSQSSLNSSSSNEQSGGQLTLTDGDDLDSDEDLPPPPPDIVADMTHVSADRLSAEFPPPPSPVPTGGSNGRSYSIAGCSSGPSIQQKVIPVNVPVVPPIAIDHLRLDTTAYANQNGHASMIDASERSCRPPMSMQLSSPRTPAGLPSSHQQNSSCNSIGAVYAQLPNNQQPRGSGSRAASTSLVSCSPPVPTKPTNASIPKPVPQFNSMPQQLNIATNAVPGAPNSAGRRSRPPPPPRRDETTRLSTIPQGFPGSPRSQPSPGAKLCPGMSPIGSATPPLSRSKPALPAKPRQVALSPMRQSSPQPPPSPSAVGQQGTGGAFLTDLQKAMQKRQRQMAEMGHREE